MHSVRALSYRWLGSLILVISSQAAAFELTGTAAVTSDYVWRGSSQTREDPALQLSTKVASDSGWYASIWGSNVEFEGSSASTELDITTGWAGRINEDWLIDLNSIYYRYPSTKTNINWIEFGGTLTWLDNYWLSAWWSEDAMASDERGTYLQLGARYPINERWRLEAAFGHYYLDGRYSDDYSHTQLSAIWSLTPKLELRGTLHATDDTARELFPDQAGSRAEFALQLAF